MRWSAKKSGSALVLVVAILGSALMAYFGLSMYLSNTARQAATILKAHELSELTLESVLLLFDKARDSRLSSTSSSHSTSREVDGMIVHNYVEERFSERTRWLSSPFAANYQMLDSIHYMSKVCDGKRCFVSTLEEVVGPQLTVFGDSYKGFPTGSLQPVGSLRKVAQVRQFSPAEIRAQLPEGCDDLSTRVCRVQFLENIRETNVNDRVYRHRFEPLRRRIKNGFYRLKDKLQERSVVALFERMDNVRLSENPDLNFRASLLEELFNVASLAGIEVEDLSLRAPLAIEEEPQLKEIYKLYFDEMPSIGKPKRFQEYYSANQVSALHHYSREKQWIRKLYQKPSSLDREMILEQPVFQTVVQARYGCFGGTELKADVFLKLNSGPGTVPSDDCYSQLNWSAKAVEKIKKQEQSPVLYYKEKPWIPLVDLWRFLEALAGKSKGFFPENPNKSSTVNIAEKDRREIRYLILRHY